MTHPLSVLLIVDPLFGTRLEDLDVDFDIWLVNSTANSLAAQSFWNKSKQESLGSLTTFSPYGDTPIEWACGSLENIETHHGSYSQDRAYDTLQVIGVDPRSELPEAFVDAGFTSIERTNDGFIAKK